MIPKPEHLPVSRLVTHVAVVMAAFVASIPRADAQDGAQARHSFRLQYSPEGFYIAYSSRGSPEPAFLKEPPYENREVLRGLLLTAPGLNDPPMGFAWEAERGILHVDINRNRDLTDDADGCFRVPVREDHFQDVAVDIPQRFGEVAATYRLNFVFGQDGFWHARIVSGWTGELELHGTSCRLRIADDMNGHPSLGDVVSFGRSDNPMEHEDYLVAVNRFFFEGRCYQLALLFTPRNWRDRAWWLLVPVLVLAAGIAGAEKLLHPALYGRSDRYLFMIVANSFVVGLAALWVRSYRLEGAGRVTKPLQAALTLAAGCAAGILCFARLDTNFVGLAALANLMAICIVLPALGAASWRCRQAYTPRRFMSWLLLWLLLLSLPWTYPYLRAANVVTWFRYFTGWLDWQPAWYHVTALCGAISLGLALALYVLLLPFILLSFLNPCYRERFQQLLLLSKESRCSVCS